MKLWILLVVDYIVSEVHYLNIMYNVIEFFIPQNTIDLGRFLPNILRNISLCTTDKEFVFGLLTKTYVRGYGFETHQVAKSSLIYTRV